MDVRWHTLRRYISAGEVLGQAEQAMAADGFVVREPAGAGTYLLIGGSAEVIVQVSAIPESADQTFVIVSAYSTDAAIAEQAARSIRRQIHEIPSSYL